MNFKKTLNLFTLNSPSLCSTSSIHKYMPIVVLLPATSPSRLRQFPEAKTSVEKVETSTVPITPVVSASWSSAHLESYEAAGPR